MTIQCDERWSFIGNKGNKQWEELAQDVESGEIIGVKVGDRGSCRSGHDCSSRYKRVYRQCSVCDRRLLGGSLSE